MANEKRLDLIDRNELLPNKVFYVCKENPVASLDELLNRIANAKTVDAVEVVHAYWTGSRFNPMTDEYEEYCSHCCAWSSEYGKPYCPNCGAKMDGDGNDTATAKD